MQMRVIHTCLLAWLLTACGDATELASTYDSPETSATNPSEGVIRTGVATTDDTDNALITDAWEGIFYISGNALTGFSLNAADIGAIRCLDGIVREVCSVQRLNLAQTGLSTKRQKKLLDLIAEATTATEGDATILVKGIMVRVSDHRTDPPTRYTEFRVISAYRAASDRAHAPKIVYVASGVQPNGYQITRTVNIMMRPRAVSIPQRMRMVWVGPTDERPNRFRADSFVSWTAFRVLPDNSGEQWVFPPVELDVDQRFKRFN